jgi:hypothetical protein
MREKCMKFSKTAKVIKLRGLLNEKSRHAESHINTVRETL